jgi:hypothetical protein
MNKAERNEQIVEALKRHGELTAAAKAVGVNRGTVRRLVTKSEVASEALLRGKEALLLKRIALHAERVSQAYSDLLFAKEELGLVQRQLREQFASMSAEQLRDWESAAEPRAKLVRAAARELRRIDQVHRRKIARYSETFGGMAS